MDDILKGALGERRRIASILNAPEATGRTALAMHLALQTGMTPVEAQRALEAAPVGQSKWEVDVASGAAEARRLLGK